MSTKVSNCGHASSRFQFWHARKNIWPQIDRHPNTLFISHLIKHAAYMCVCVCVKEHENNEPQDQYKAKVLIKWREHSPALQAGRHHFYSRWAAEIPFGFMSTHANVGVFLLHQTDGNKKINRDALSFSWRRAERRFCHWTQHRLHPEPSWEKLTGNY